jgi:FdrA protein
VIEKIVLKKQTYRDSVFLMVIRQEVHEIAGIAEVVVMMSTDNNKNIIKDVGFKGPMLETATPRDMLICIRADNENVIEDALSKIDEMLSRKPTQGKSEGVFKTLDSAVKENSSINFAVISVPGDFAAREAKKALTLGLNVLLFSDNVSIEEEIELKNFASRLDRILMGPDCGTAIINKVPLAFANVVRAGSIGVIAAAGTGQQEVVSLIDQNGGGISQSMGTGGRDVTDVVGGISMLKGIEILEKDKETDIIVLVSKPPGQATMKKVLQRLQTATKKSVVCFLGGDPNVIAQYGIIPATTIEECALRAVATAEGRAFEYKHFSRSVSEIDALIKKETKQMSKGQKYLRGLYSGGTLCDTERCNW